MKKVNERLLVGILFVLVLVVFFLVLMLFSLLQWNKSKITGAVVYEDISTCRELNESNTVYRLTTDVSSAGTCFNVTNNSITIDCQGHKITYGTGTGTHYGVYSDRDSIVIKNCTITTSSTTDTTYGIYLRDSSHNVIESVNASYNQMGIFLDHVTSTNISDTITNHNSIRGIEIRYGAGNELTNITSSYNSVGISVWSLGSFSTDMRDIVVSHNTAKGLITEFLQSSNIENVLAEENGEEGIKLGPGTAWNTLRNITINGCSSAGAYACIHFFAAGNNQLYDVYVNNSDNYGIWIVHDGGAWPTCPAKNNLFTNLTIENSASYDVYIEANDDGDATGNTFLNASYTTDYVAIGSEAELIRKWWLDVYVNDSYGSSLENANVTAYDQLGNLSFTQLTGASGWIGRQEVISYVKTQTATIDYNNYTINISKSGYYPYSESRNVSSNDIVLATLQPVEAPDAVCVGSSPQEYLDWQVIQPTICEDGKIDLGEDRILNITAGSSLTLRNVTLRLYPSQNGSAGIHVYGGLELNGSTISLYPSAFGNRIFFIAHENSAVNISDSHIEYVGWSNTENEKGIEVHGRLYAKALTVNNSYYGLVLYSPNNTIEDSRINADSVDVETIGNDNVLVNVSYGTELSPGSLERKWYVEIYAKTSVGQALSNANISALYNGQTYATALTDSNGYALFELPQYRNESGTTTSYTFEIRAEKQGYETVSTQTTVSGNLVDANNITLILQPQEDTGGISGGSSGGGGGGGSRIYNFSVMPEFVSYELKQGESGIKDVSIKNTGTLPLELKIAVEGDISRFLFVEDSVLLQRGETQNLSIKFFAGNYTGTYHGKLLFSYSGVRHEIPLILDIKPKEALLDAILEIKNKDNVVRKGEHLQLVATILNFGEAGKVDVLLQYQILDMNGTPMYEKHETVAVETQLNRFKELALPQLPEGTYIVVVKATYNNVTVSSSDMIFVEGGEEHTLGKNIKIVVVFLLVIILVILFLKLTQRRKSKR